MGNKNRELSEREIDAIDARIAAERAQTLARGKARAEAEGWEPFDLDKFEELYRVGGEEPLKASRDERLTYYEEMYYTGTYKTIAEFARRRLVAASYD